MKTQSLPTRVPVRPNLESDLVDESNLGEFSSHGRPCLIDPSTSPEKPLVGEVGAEKRAAGSPAEPASLMANNQMLCGLSLDEWQEFAHTHPDTTPFHHRNWIELLIDTYKFKLHIPALKQNGQVLSAVPFLETRNVWGAKKLISLPFTDCMSILAEDPDAAARLRQELTAQAGRKYDAIVIRSEKPCQQDGSRQWTRHVIATSKSLDEITARFERTLRTNLRRCKNRNLVFQVNNDSSAVETLYRLLAKTRRRHGVPIQPKKFFRGIHDRLLKHDLGYVGLASKAGEAIGAGLFIKSGDKMTCKYLASEPKALDERPNEFLLYHGIRMAVEMRCSTFDFGISKVGQHGLRRFKRKFGATENDVQNDHFIGGQRFVVEDSRAMKIVSAMIRHSPIAVSQITGELFYRYSQ